MKFKVIDNTFLEPICTIRTYFANATESIWDKRNKLKVININEKSLIIKSFKVPHFINKIAYTFLRASKAQRSYENSLKILEFVPQPIGYAEFFKWGLLYDSYFVCEKYDYDFTIREPLTQSDFPEKEAVFKAFASFTHALHRQGIEHLDYSPGNILIKKRDKHRYEFKIIDVNRMKFTKFTKKECLENFAKLWSNDSDLKIIITEYAKLIFMEKEEALAIVRKASQKHKDKKNFKKKLFKYIKKKRITKEDNLQRKAFLEHISVVMMAKNAEETIAQSLDALSIFDEIILYLNHSTDQTKAIAQNYENVKIIEGEFLGFGKTKQKAQSYSTHAWILSLDSDEILNPTLIDALSYLDFTDPTQLIQLKRDNYFLGHKTQDSDKIIRIYNKHFTSFNDSKVHEKIIIPLDAKIITIPHSFVHLNISNINQTLTKLIHYTDLSIEDNKTCFFSIVLAKAFFAFIKVYILKGNFLKGWVGFTLGINAANRRYYKYLKQFILCKKL